MMQRVHWPPPPYEWHVLRLNDDVEEWLPQWQHYEPLLASCGYTVTWADVNKLAFMRDECPRSFHLPPAADPFSPKKDEWFVAVPIGPIFSSMNNPLVRVARDAQERPVAIKAMLTSSDEYAIVKYLRNLRLVAPDPADHTIPILDVIEVDTTAFVVMPRWNDSVVPFWTLLDVLDQFEECLQGLVFMHEHRIAHMDIYMWNILMNFEGLAPFKWTPRPFRSLFDARYAYIDFGHSKQFPKEMQLSSCMTSGNVTGATPAPEQLENAPFNAFSVDVYQLGRAFIDYLKEDEPFTNIWELVDLHMPGLSPLMEEMTSKDPASRPSAEHALQALRAIRSQTPSGVLSLHAELKDGVKLSGIPNMKFEDGGVRIVDPENEDDSDHNVLVDTAHDNSPGHAQAGFTGETGDRV